MYCHINGWVYFERKAPFAKTLLKKGGGHIFEGGLIFGYYGYYVAYITTKSYTILAELLLMGEFSPCPTHTIQHW